MCAAGNKLLTKATQRKMVLFDSQFETAAHTSKKDGNITIDKNKVCYHCDSDPVNMKINIYSYIFHYAYILMEVTEIFIKYQNNKIGLKSNSKYNKK